MKNSEPSLYFGNWLFSSVVEEDSLTRSYKYRLLICITVLTGLLMWTYSLVATFFVAGTALSIIGFVCSIIHACSPLVYRKTNSMVAAAYVMVTAGIVFQFSFSYFSGGFYSPTLLWFSLLPMIVGILTNKTHALVWIFICALDFLLMFFLHHKNMIPVSQISDEGRVVAQFMVGLGLIGLVGGFTLFFIELAYFYHNKIAAKNTQIRQLFRAITHDILNPLASVEFLHNKLQSEHPELQADLARGQRTVSTIRQTVENARYFDAADSGRVVLNLLPVSLKNAFEALISVFEDRLAEKQLQLEFCPEIFAVKVLGDEASLKVHVLGNAISNAIKFSAPGEKIQISGVSHGDEFEVIIRDHGRGIPPERLAQWEVSGVLSSTAGTWGEKGTGFGLLLMKHYLEKAHGYLQIHSISEELDPTNKGTRISLFLKRASDL